jgi:hypothetical protein
MRHVLPNTTSSAGWMISLNGSDGAGGMEITTQLITAAKIIAAKPAR